MIRGITNGVDVLSKKATTEEAKTLAASCLTSLAERFKNIESHKIFFNRRIFGPAVQKESDF